jgi:hypothetical protein
MLRGVKAFDSGVRMRLDQRLVDSAMELAEARWSRSGAAAMYTAGRGHEADRSA